MAASVVATNIFAVSHLVSSLPVVFRWPYGRMEERGYTVVRILGQGGQGRVYEVRNRDGELRVLKQLSVLGDSSKASALTEIRLLSSLRHPCIVPYLDSFLARSVPSIASEDVLCLIIKRCERDLHQDLLSRREQCSHVEEPLVISWLTQLCWGLQHLHSRKFMHRDLKPQNVLLTLGSRVLLADFGMAGQLQYTQELKQTVVGTPSFMSPEMLNGRPYGCKTDQWALGCVLFEIMALKAPFEGCMSYAAIVTSVLHSPPMRAPPGYSPKLSTVLEALLAKQPDDRPSNDALLQGELLYEPFRTFIKNLKVAIAAGLGSKRSVVPASDACAEKDADAESYGSDFESYTGSDPDSDQVREVGPESASFICDSTARREICMQEVAASMPSADHWRKLFAEVEALLHPSPAFGPLEQVAKIRQALVRELACAAEVDRALAFLRERRPLGGTADMDDELVLQIEVCDAFGERGLHALPLLERCLALEALAAAAVTPTSDLDRSLMKPSSLP